jgi:hypothetical protein
VTVTPEPDLDLSPDTEVYGPQPPTQEELWLAQDAPCEASAAGCSAAEYDRLVTARMQTEATYLETYDRDLLRVLEADPDPEPEAEPW